MPYTDPVDWLDGPLWHLGRPLEDALDIVTVRAPAGRAALLFTGEARARAHLPPLPSEVEVIATDAGDLRAKEELFRAALARGGALIWLDATPDPLEPELETLSARALAYILSQKREAACL